MVKLRVKNYGQKLFLDKKVLKINVFYGLLSMWCKKCGFAAHPSLLDTSIDGTAGKSTFHIYQQKTI